VNDAVEKIETYMGLVKVIPTGATNGTVDATGTVTIGSAVSSVTVSGCFSSLYNNYKICVSGSGSATNSENLIMTLNGGTTDYYGNLIYGLYAGAASLYATVNNGANWPFMGYSTFTSGIITTIEVMNPNLAEYTTIQSVYVNAGGAGTFTGFRNTLTQHTGFTLAPTAGTITGGTITVYGYRI
jgi:hypothetical protein